MFTNAPSTFSYNRYLTCRRISSSHLIIFITSTSHSPCLSNNTLFYHQTDWLPHRTNVNVQRYIAASCLPQIAVFFPCFHFSLPLTSPPLLQIVQEEWTKLRESVPYVELYRYNPKHLYPKLNGYGDNGQRSLKLWQLLHTYWLPNTYWNWQEYAVSVMLISVPNIKVTCEWHKAIKLNYKNTRTTVVFVLRFPSTLCKPQLIRYLAKVTALRC